MSDNPEIVRLQTAAIAEMEELKAFSSARWRPERSSERKMVLALIDQDDKVHALAGAIVSAIKGLIVQSVVVNPAELNKQHSTAWFGLKDGLELLAQTIDVKLDDTPISGNPEPVCVRISRAREDDDTQTAEAASVEASPDARPARSWTRWASRARDLDAAVAAEDYSRATRIQAEFDALAPEDDATLNRLADKLDAAVAGEDYQTAAKIKAQLDAALRKREE